MQPYEYNHRCIKKTLTDILLSSITVLCPLVHSLLQYHFVNTALSWSEAQTFCRRHHTDLATVFHIEDMNRLVNSAKATGGFTQTAWIGLFDDLASWRWSSVDSRYYGDVKGDYRNWDYGQPDNFNGEEMCVKMWSGGVWEDSKCFLKNPFICGPYGGPEGSTHAVRKLGWLIFVSVHRNEQSRRALCVCAAGAELVSRSEVLQDAPLGPGLRPQQDREPGNSDLGEEPERLDRHVQVR